MKTYPPYPEKLILVSPPTFLKLLIIFEPVRSSCLELAKMQTFLVLNAR